MLSIKTFLAGTLLASALPATMNAETFIGNRDDFRDETIYFAITTRFYDGDPTNNVLCWDGQADQIANNDPCWRGDFKGLIEKLDYIKALGFTTVWVTPIVQNCSGFDYHGYHAMDFSKVDLRYESRKAWGASEDVTFQSLIDAAHAKGMKVVLDIVLNHTGNFGEAHFAKLFDRNPSIRNQATATGSLIPDESKLGSDYFDLAPNVQYDKRFPYLKNSGGKNLDVHNYWHHVGTGWNWDYPSRWWGQIAGDCVDLNTENKYVSDYLVECYGKFIEMGVDGFRIDTTGHIAPLTFNKVFIPQFKALGEKYKDKRLNGCEFFMFGECCARYSEPQYRGQDNLSSYYYTWKSPQSLLDQWNDDPTWWDNQVIYEGSDDPVGNMALCMQDTQDRGTSDNVFMKNGRWHEPDYSQYSGFSVIDFPMHYNFNNAGQAVDIAKKGDKKYNDASYNVVYVDSHDYCPGPNDGVRFNGGTSQWAENLALMFTFRGIPCIYYGSEVEFQKGVRIDEGPNLALKNSGRAYYGAYLEGNVNAIDFGEYTADGNIATTLNGDLACHIRRLNQIRAAVPALRKGQYTWDGCSANGGWAFKRAYKDESYALVAINGGATFSQLPAGNYIDVVTGESYTATENGSITVNAPKTQGQLRVLVKDWKGGKIGEDGKFIYANSPASHGGNPSFSDPGTTSWYGPDDVIGNPAVVLSPAGGYFRTATLTVNVSLNKSATSGWYKLGNNPRVELSKGEDTSFTIGADMAFDDTVTVTWGAVNEEGRLAEGSHSYTKLDPNAEATYTLTFQDEEKNWQNVNCYVWDQGNGNFEALGKWPGKAMDKTTLDGKTAWTITFKTTEPMVTPMCIFNSNGAQTADLTLTNNGVYDFNGLKMSIVAATTATAGIRISVANGELLIDSDHCTELALTRVDGTCLTLSVTEGHNIFSGLQRGVYVIAGHKVIL